MKKRQLYILVHNHKYGISTYPVLSNHFPTAEEIIEIWKIDFEPDREEWINVEEGGEPKIIK